jgi:hypothetical protein
VQQIDAALKVKGEEVSDIKEMGKSFIHSLFHGVLVNETRCLNCETTSTRKSHSSTCRLISSSTRV